MNNFKIGKKFLALVMAVIMAFSGIAVYAAEPVAEIAVTEEHEHIFGEWEIKTPATCKTEGKKVRECLKCHAKDAEVVIPIDENAHNPGSEVVISEATCTSNGVSKFTCTLCYEEYEIETAKLGHVFERNASGNEIWVVVTPVEHMEKHYRDGLANSTCTRCKLTVTKILPVEHDFTGAVPNVVKPATCREPGYQDTVCNICHYSIRTDLPIDKDSHVYSGKADIISEGFNCKTDGEGIIVCEACDIVTTITVSKDKAHDYIEWEVTTPIEEGATCLTNVEGYKSRYCETCHKELESAIIKPPHNFVEYKNGEEISHVTAIVAATCCTEGYYQGNCVDCRAKDVKNYIPADKDAHVYVVDKITEQPTCTTKGQRLLRCKYDASHYKYEDIDMLEHTYEREWEIVDATCIKDGYKKNYCGVCNKDIVISIPKDPEAHDLEGQTWKQEKASDCDVQGYEVASCKNCHNLISRDLPLCYNTSYKLAETKATCYSDGEIKYTCWKCGKLRTEVTPKDTVNHVPSVGYKEIKSATCYEHGIKTRICINCDAVIEENQIVIPVKNHTITEIVDKAPVCKDNTPGSKHHKCINPGCVYESGALEIPAYHNYTAWSYPTGESSANCTTPITRERVCYTCHHVDTDNNYYGGHQLGAWEFLSGSCEDGGVLVKKCSYCDKSDETKTIRAGEHGDLVLTLDGIPQTETICYGQKYECKICNKTYEITRPHSFIVLEAGFAPTCALPGLTDSKYCTTCKLKIEQMPLSKLEHEYAYDSEGSKYCLKCNEYEVKFDDGRESTSCNHFCHNQGTIAKVMKLVFTFFWKLFGTNQVCKCGAIHYEIETEK